MAHEGEDQDQEQPPGVRLARLLRRWWEESGNAPGGTRPTQQALAAKLGIDQTTLSRYLNPKHASTAPSRVVEALHAQLRAPAAELALARRLCLAALEENNRRGTGGNEPEPPAGTGTGNGTDGRDAPGRPRPRWASPALVAAAMVLSFVAGAVVRDQVAPDPRATAVPRAAAAPRVAAGAVPASGAPAQRPLEWPLLMKRKDDQFTRGRALQHLLRAHGYEVKADGFFGDDTRDAVMDFQSRNHLPADGKVGKDTWPELVEPLGRGADGPAVLALQELLHNAGQGGTEVSGEFTAATAEDLRFFQSGHGLPPTGRADVDTWLALLVFQRPPAGTPAYQRSTSASPSASQ